MWIFGILLLLVWATILSTIAYRLVHDVPFFTKLSCTACTHRLSLIDTIPLISYFFSYGKCRYCKTPISIAYCALEVLTPLTIFPLWFCFPWYTALSYTFFFSALLITVYTDSTTMLISRFVTIFLIPISFVVSYFGYLPLSLSESIIGTLAGYCILKTISFIFFKLTHKEGLGEGDVDLLAFIGSWIGLVGVWATLLLASITGSIVGIIYMITTGRIKDSMNSKDPVLLPFGPFLALSAIAFIYFQVYCPVMPFLIS